MGIEFDLDEYKASVLKQIHQDVNRENPIKRRLRLAEFTSNSAGKGKRRETRDVKLLVVDNNHAFCVIGNEIRERKNRDFISSDVLANEILEDLPLEERTTEKLLEILSK